VKTKIRFVIADVHMGLGRNGLNEIIRLQKKRSHLFAQALKTSNELILFVNKARDKAKLFSQNGSVLAYLFLERGQVISTKSVDMVFHRFGGSAPEYSEAVTRALIALENDVKAKRKDLTLSSRLAS